MLYYDYFGQDCSMDEYAQHCNGWDEKEIFEQVLSDLRDVQSNIEAGERLTDGADGDVVDVARQIAQEVWEHMTEWGKTAE